MRKFTFFLVTALAMFVCQVAVQAQTTGSLAGVVVDQNGAIVAGATVTVKNNETGDERKATSNDNGVYSVGQLNPGVYTITVETKGFKKAVHSDVLVSLNIETKLDIGLQIGLETETVTVTAGQEVINTSSPTLTKVVDIRQVSDLPLSTRNPLDLAALQAGIAIVGTDIRNSSISGLRGSNTNITQDGINVMDNFVKTSSLFGISTPTLNSTAEFSITTGTVGSEAGRGVGQVNVVTKGGTNDFHGGIFYLHRNDALNSNSWFNNQGATFQPRARQRQHFFGFDIGGPLMFPAFGEGGDRWWNGRDTAHWFVSYEGFRENFSVTRNRTVLSPEARLGLYRYPRTCPTAVPDPNCSNNIQTVNLLAIGDVSTLNPITSPFLNSTPLPNNTDANTDLLNLQGFRYAVLGADINDKWVGRYDHHLTKSSAIGAHKIEFVFNRGSFSLIPDTFNSLESPFPGDLYDVDAGQTSKRYLVTGALVSTFGDMSNVFRYGRQWAPVLFERLGGFSEPFISFTGITSKHNTFLTQGRDTRINQITDNFSMPKGNHLFRFGGDFQNIFADTINDTGVNQTINIGAVVGAAGTTNPANLTGIVPSELPGSTSTNQTNAQNIYAALTGLLFSSNRTLNVSSATSGFVPGFTRARIFKQKDLALYFQDQWRVKNNLTVSIGVRWDYMGVPTIPNGLAIQPTDVDDMFGISGPGNLFNPNAPPGAAPGIATLDFVSGDTGVPLYNEDWNNFAPFIGIAYSPDFKSGIGKFIFGESGKSSIRLGYSISYLHDGFTAISNAMGTGNTNPGLIGIQNNTTPTGVLTATPPALPALTFKVPITDRENIDANPAASMWGIDPNIKAPYVQQWNIGFEREIFKDTAIEIRYTGNLALKQWRAVDFNEVNIFENGFLDEFKIAQKNLALYRAANPNCATNVAGNGFPCRFGNAGLTGQANLPWMSRFFTGFSATSGSGFASTGFIGNLDNQNVGGMANTLAFSATYNANRDNPAVGIPANYFVANPNAAAINILGNDSMSNYHALQFEIRRRFSSGLQFQIDYTYSKTMVNAAGLQGSQSESYSFWTLRNKELDYVRSSQDQTHRIVGNAIYELPFGRGKPFLSDVNGFVDRIVGGWTIGSIVTWATRPPFTFTSGRTTFNEFSGQAHMLRPDAYEYLRSHMGIFKTTYGIFFIDPSILTIATNSAGRLTSASLPAGVLGPAPLGEWGNFPENSINGPSYWNIDMSLVKRIPITETVRFELKTTFINALNHPNFTYGGNVFDSGSFGQITGQSGSVRIIHFTGSVRF